MPTRPATDETLTIVPPPAFRMDGRTACVTAIEPKRLTSNWARHSSGVTSSTAPYWP